MEFKAEKINTDILRVFGSILNPNDCGLPLSMDDNNILYYPDKMPISFPCGSVLTINPLIIKKRPLVINSLEFHNNTEEIIGGFTEDIILYCGLPSEKPDFSKFWVFILPKYYFFRMKRKIWHGAPFLINKDQAQGLVILPPFTYLIDAEVINIKETIKIEVPSLKQD